MVAIHIKMSGLPDKVIEDSVEYETESQAELRALRWLLYCPDDIVMIYEPQTCVNCGQPIEYRGDNVRIKWAHTAGYYACFPDGRTQAEPKES